MGLLCVQWRSKDFILVGIYPIYPVRYLSHLLSCPFEVQCIAILVGFMNPLVPPVGYARMYRISSNRSPGLYYYYVRSLACIRGQVCIQGPACIRTSTLRRTDGNIVYFTETIRTFVKRFVVG